MVMIIFIIGAVLLGVTLSLIAIDINCNGFLSSKDDTDKETDE